MYILLCIKVLTINAIHVRNLENDDSRDAYWGTYRSLTKEVTHALAGCSVWGNSLPTELTPWQQHEISKKYF